MTPGPHDRPMTSSLDRPRARRGFSLIELLVSIVIIMALVGTMSGFTWDVLRTRTALATEAQRTRGVNLFFDRLERDLQTAVATGPGGRPGFDGDASGLSVAVHTVPIRLAAPGRGTAALGASEWAAYAFDQPSRTMRLERWTAGEPRVPLAGVIAGPDEDAALDPDADPDAPLDDPVTGTPPAGFEDPDEDAPIPADPRVIGSDIFRVEFRYHDGRGWRDGFTSGSRGGLPVAVEVSIWFDPWPGAEDELADELAGELADELAGDAPFDPAGDNAAADFAAGDPDDPLDVFADGAAFDDRPPPDRRRIIAIPDARAGERRDELEAFGPDFGDPNGFGDDGAFSPDPLGGVP